MREVNTDTEASTPYECFDCGSIVTAEQHPGTCSDCGGPMRNRWTALE